MLEEVVRLGVRLLMQSAIEAAVTEFLDRGATATDRRYGDMTRGGIPDARTSLVRRIASRRGSHE